MLPVDLATGSRVTERGQGGTTITEAFRTDGRGHADDTQYRIVSEADAALRIEGDQYGEQQYPDNYRYSYYGDRQNPDGYYYRYYGNSQGGYRVAPPSPYQQSPQYPQHQQRGLFGSWSSDPPPQQQPQRRFDPDVFWRNRMN